MCVCVQYVGECSMQYVSTCMCSVWVYVCMYRVSGCMRVQFMGVCVCSTWVYVCVQYVVHVCVQYVGTCYL